MNLEPIVFIVTGLVALVSAILMVTRRNPVKSVLFLIVNFFCLAVIYLLLRAQFIAIIEILVYAGAIMVLFLFVIMLLNMGTEETRREGKQRRGLFAAFLGTAVFVEILVGLRLPTGEAESGISTSAGQMGTVESIGKTLYTGYIFPFEVTSLLLLAAMVGVIVLARRKIL
ncbi:MAG TPA: NADH-quinone oxidoreductase subunit J [Bacteroidota bacterium]|nr:NADH-quinone oxidoreductase subunit J [Bacteroidota bacterium]